MYCSGGAKDENPDNGRRRRGGGMDRRLLVNTSASAAPEPGRAGRDVTGSMPHAPPRRAAPPGPAIGAGRRYEAAHWPWRGEAGRRGQRALEAAAGWPGGEARWPGRAQPPLPSRGLPGGRSGGAASAVPRQSASKAGGGASERARVAQCVVVATRRGVPARVRCGARCSECDNSACESVVRHECVTACDTSPTGLPLA